MAKRANIRDFFPAGTPVGQAWWALPAEQRETILAEANVKRNAQIAQRKIEIAEEKAAKDKLARTCQICGRRIFAEVGVIAHHGYERPGDGWQTASCRGARRLPYEADHAALDEEIEWVTERLADAEELLRKYKAEEVAFSFQWVDQVERRKNPGSPFAGFRYMKDITRTNWDALKADPENAEAFRQCYSYNFDQLKERTCDDQQDKVDSIRTYLKQQQRRRSEWVHKEDWEQTDRYYGKWVAVEVKASA